MSLSTNQDPKVITGNIAELPNPSSMPAGTTFFSLDTGEEKVLLIDPATGIRSWNTASLSSGITAVMQLVFGGGFTTSLGGPVTGYLANSANPTSSTTPLEYPLYTTALLNDLTVNVDTNNSDVPVVIQVFVNDVGVGVAQSIPAGFVGQFAVPVNVVAFINSNISLKITAIMAIAVPGTVHLTATV